MHRVNGILRLCNQAGVQTNENIDYLGTIQQFLRVQLGKFIRLVMNSTGKYGGLQHADHSFGEYGELRHTDPSFKKLAEKKTVNKDLCVTCGEK